MRLLWLAPVHYDAQRDVHPAPWISQLARRLTDEHDISIHFLNYQPRLPEAMVEVKKEGMRYTFLRTPSPKLDHLGFFQKRIRILRDYIEAHRAEYDLVHIHGSEHQYETVMAGLDLPHVLSMQGVMNECLPRLGERFTYNHLSWWMSARFERKNLGKLQHYICRTKFDSGFVRTLNPKADIHENWEMIRPEFFQPLGDPRSKDWLYMGGTHPIKGIQILLPAFDALLEHHDVRLNVLGSTNVARIQQLIREQNLPRLRIQHLNLMGFRDVQGVVEAMKTSRAMIHSSLIDNSPNSVCEAQVGGLPVVSTDVGGIPELIRHGETGLLARPEAASLSTQMRRLMEDDQLWTELSRKSTMMAQERHDPKTITLKTLDIYNKARDAR